jgi:hypothetical protein
MSYKYAEYKYSAYNVSGGRYNVLPQKEYNCTGVEYKWRLLGSM